MFDRLVRRDREIAHAPLPHEPSGSIGKLTRVDGSAGSLAAVRDRLLVLRAEGRASSREAVTLLGRLLTRPGDVFVVEAFLATGAIDRGADPAHWLPALDAQRDDVRAGYDAAIRNRRGPGLAEVLDRARRPVSTGGGDSYRDIPLEDFIAPDRRSDSRSAIIIGNAEGTRTPGGGKTWAYGEHIDPGNSARNRGSYSLQGATQLTPAEADRVQQQRMRARLPAYVAACEVAELPPTNAIALTTYFDLYNIKPALATAFGPLLPELVSLGVTHEHAIDLRVKASQRTQPRKKWTGWEKIARGYLHKPSAQISDAEFWRVVRIVHAGRAARMRDAMTALGIATRGSATARRTAARPAPTRATPTPARDDPRSYRLVGSVGAGGDNHPPDVGAVQARLGDVGLQPGAVDRRCGPKTIAAIEKYQRALMKHPDGLVEVGRTTERNLFGLGGVVGVVDVNGGGQT